MKTRLLIWRNPQYLGLAIIGALSLILGLAMQNLFPGWQFVNEPVHSSMEAFGALAAIIMSFFLLIREWEEADGKTLMIAMGFLSMGMLDVFHAVSPTGSGFVLLRSLASLMGGFFFALVWFPVVKRLEPHPKWLPWVVMSASVILGSWILAFKETLPAMLYQGEFTIAAKAINFIAGVLFVAAAVRLMIDFHNSGKTEYCTFSCLALLFGISSLTFDYSRPWDALWWFWHILRMTASIVLLGWLASKHKSGVDRLRSALDKQKQVEKELTKMSSRQQAILAAVPDIIMEVDTNDVYTWTNQAGFDFFGYDVLGKEAAFYFEGEQETRAAIPLFKGLEDIVYFENWQRRRDGKKCLLAWWCRVLKDGQGNFAGSLSTARDITEIKELEQQKADFYAMLTHDLKSPLISIMGYADLLEGMADTFSADTMDMIKSIRSSGERLTRLVEDFLSVSKMDAGAFALNVASYDIGQTLKETYAGFEKVFQEKGLVFNTEIADVLPKVKIDQKLVQRAVFNLLQNAVNYTQSEGRITLKAEPIREKGGDFILISVADTGEGIHAEEQDKVFEKYYRSPKTSGVKGTGLGLSIVKAVAEAHGGRVELESEAGKGSTFKLILPLD